MHVSKHVEFRSDATLNGSQKFFATGLNAEEAEITMSCKCSHNSV